VLGRGGALVGLAAAVVLTVGGIGAAVAVQPNAQPGPPAQPQTRVITVLDESPVPPTTTTTRPAPTPAAAGSASATITVILTRPAH
jgi:hypothetical protein